MGPVAVIRSNKIAQDQSSGRRGLRLAQQVVRAPVGLPSRVAPVRLFAIAIIGAGLVFRLSQFFSGRSMWLDESVLAINVLDRSVGGLSHRLDFEQGAPLGFLVVVKVLQLAFGKSEDVLRLFPLLCGIGALPLMYVVARKVTTEAGALIALVLFACADGLIYYSTELKQYSCDVIAGLAISAVAITPGRPTWRRYAAACVVGAVAIWFSHATFFFLPAIFIAYGTYFVTQRAWSDLGRILIVSLLLLGVSSAFFYEISFRDLAHLQSTVGNAGTSGGGLRVVISNVGEAMGLPFSPGRVPALVRPLALGSALVGAIFLLRRRFDHALILGLPIAFVIGATALHRYPTFERTLLFVIPGVSLFVAHGISSISRLARRSALIVIVGTALAILVVEHPVTAAARHLAHPREREEIKPLLFDLAHRWQPGDSLYVYYSAQYAFRYYRECGCLGASSSTPPLSFATEDVVGRKLFSRALRSRPPQFVVGLWAQGNQRLWKRDHYAIYRRDVRKMLGQPRVWLLFSHANSIRELRFEDTELPRLLDRLGTRITRISRFHSELFLYDLRTKGRGQRSRRSTTPP